MSAWSYNVQKMPKPKRSGNGGNGPEKNIEVAYISRNQSIPMTAIAAWDGRGWIIATAVLKGERIGIYLPDTIYAWRMAERPPLRGS